MTVLPLSLIVITHNEAANIARCLDSVPFAAEKLIIDSGSTDDTVAIAQARGARVVHQDWLGYAAQKNHAMSLATQPWLLLLDADEWLADGAADSIRTLFTGNLIEEADAWVLTRHNWFLGRRLRQGEPSERLVRPGWRYLEALVHERPDLAGKRLRPLDAVIEHDTARSYADHLRKHQRYAQLWAQQRHANGKRSYPGEGWVHALAYLLKSYLLRGALLEGREGWLYHLAHMHYVVDKYRFLRQLGASKQGG